MTDETTYSASFVSTPPDPFSTQVAITVHRKREVNDIRYVRLFPAPPPPRLLPDLEDEDVSIYPA